jgi:MFS family permease
VPRNSKPAAILAIILISYFMILLDNSVIFTGLPSIRAGLDLSLTGLSWVQDAYTLVFGGLLLLALGLLAARRRASTAGLVVVESWIRRRVRLGSAATHRLVDGRDRDLLRAGHHQRVLVGVDELPVAGD